MTIDYASYLIPKYLDEPERLLFFTYKELALFMAPFGMGVLLGHTFKGMLCAIALFFLYKKLNPSNQSTSIVHIMYWYFPSWFIPMKQLPSSEVKIFL
jgi:type IV conjugative transfer system protein TraL